MSGSAVFYRNPGDEYPTIIRGQGCYLWDDSGRKYLDLSSGISATAGIGQGRADIAEAMTAQATQLAFIHNARVTNDPQEALASRLADLSPGGTGKVMFTSGGSEANELSLRIARQYHLARGEPDRTKIVSLTPSYHGATVGALSMTGRLDINRDYAPYLLPVIRVPAPITYRGRWAGLSADEVSRRFADAVGDAIEAEGAHKVAAFIIEPISPSAGLAIPPEGCWSRIREICDHYGILMIVDEIITGAGRTGRFLGIEHFGVIPDLTNLAKGLGGGYVPLGATLISDHVADTISTAKRQMGEVHTFSGAPLSCAVGLAVLNVIEREGLVEAAREKGHVLQSLLRDHLLDLPAVGAIRGIGLMQAVEYVKSKETKEIYPADVGVAQSLWSGMWERGFLLGTMRVGNTLVGDCTFFYPPLVIDEAELERGVAALREVIQERSTGWD